MKSSECKEVDEEEMEVVREFKITIYMDSNKRTEERIFYSIPNAIEFLKKMSKEGLMNIDWKCEV